MIRPWKTVNSKAAGDFSIFTIRSDRKVSPRTPILLSSGYSPVERPEVLTPTETLGFLPKPYRSRDLKEHVARLLHHSAS